MSELPPVIREAEFLAVHTKNKEEIRQKFTPLIHALHLFLNQTSCLHDIQRIRGNRDTQRTHGSWKRRIAKQPAFSEFTTEPRHWYTHNTGGRNEAQFNIGLFPQYLRVGLGFEFTRGIYGNPEAVQSAYGAFTTVLRQHRQVFDNFVQENFLEVEWRPAGKIGLSALRCEPTQRVLKWLLRPSQAADWIFVGRLLDRREDAKILEDPVQLKEVMETVFQGLRHLWEETQVLTKRIE